MFVRVCLLLIVTTLCAVGVIFHGIGMKQVSVVSTNSEAIFTIEGKRVSAILAPNDSQAVHVTLLETTNTKKSSVLQAKRDILNELCDRKADIAFLQEEIEDELENIEDKAVDGEQMDSDMVDVLNSNLSCKFSSLLATKASYIKRINEVTPPNSACTTMLIHHHYHTQIEGMTKITVNYSIKCGPTATLLPGQF